MWHSEFIYLLDRFILFLHYHDLDMLISFTPSLIHSLTHSLTHSLLHLLTDSLTHSLTHALPPSFTHSLSTLCATLLFSSVLFFYCYVEDADADETH